jgi:glycerol-3-phosphate acyltransferase PlsY
MLEIAPWTVALLLPVVAAVVWRSRFVSLGSLTGALLAPLVTAALVPLGQATWAGVAFATGSAALVTAAHADNIERLRAGTERRIGR